MTETTFPKRQCGGCTLCCTALPIVEFAKPAGITCQHCTSSGCGVYATREKICREFLCGWIVIPRLDESWRPDRSGIIIRVIEKKDLPEAFRAAGEGLHFTVVGGEASIRRPGFADYVATLVRRNVAVWLSADSPKTLVNKYLEPMARARDNGALTAMLLHLYGLHVQLRQSQGKKPLPWVTPS